MLVDRFLRKTLTEEEEAAFLARMQRDPDLAEEVYFRSIELEAFERLDLYWQLLPASIRQHHLRRSWFYGLFATATFMGTFATRTHPSRSAPAARTDETEDRPGVSG